MMLEDIDVRLLEQERRQCFIESDGLSFRGERGSDEKVVLLIGVIM